MYQIPSGTFNSKPAAGAYKGRWLFAGRGGDNAVWMNLSSTQTTSVPSGYTGWQSHGGVFNFGPAIAVRPDQTDFKVFGVGTNNKLWQTTCSGTPPSCNGWSEVPSNITFNSEPAAVYTSSSTLFLAARSTDNDYHVATFTGSSWSSFRKLNGGTFTSAPTLAGWGPTHVEIYGLGPRSSTTREARIRRAVHENGWGPWLALSGNYEHAPAAYAPRDGTVNVIARGYSIDRRFYRTFSPR
jgi:hypothetical protein